MSKATDTAVQAILEALDNEVEDLSREEYREVLEELEGEIVTRKDAVESELEE